LTSIGELSASWKVTWSYGSGSGLTTSMKSFSANSSKRSNPYEAPACQEANEVRAEDEVFRNECTVSQQRVM
jgi:hypothetical protein